MRRFAALLVVFALASLACGGGDDAAPAAPATAAPESPSATVSPSPTASPSATVPPAATSGASTTDGPPAPDFTLALGRDAGTFTLSAEQKPVYMVFWAEW